MPTDRTDHSQVLRIIAKPAPAKPGQEGIDLLMLALRHESRTGKLD